MSPSPQSPKNVSLPSINELFPEHLLAKQPSPIQRYSSSSSRTSPTTRYAPEPNFNYPQTSAIITVPARSRRDPTPPTSPGGVGQVRGYDAYVPSNGPSSGHGGASCPGPCCAQAARLSHPASAPSVSYERSMAQDAVAPGPNGPDSQRTALSSSFGYAACTSDTSMSSITKAKPAFRVELRMPESVHGLSVPPFDRFPRPDEHKGPAPYPPNFSANPYLSGAGAPGISQGLRGPTSPQDGPPGSEEKRHCCPHCNKRFNRPSSLNIHVNTHTGAKPFVCSYPGCNRRFNVNSNMRRHYRNHLTSRRRDAVARLIQHPPGGSSHSPPMSVSPSHSPEPTYPHNGSSYHYPRPPYSLEHSTSYSDPEEYEAARSPSSTTSSVRHHPYPRPPSPPSSYYSSDVKRETPEPALPVGVPESNMRDDRELERAQCRLRSNSSPVPRYREDRALRHAEPACDRPGCSCNTRPVSTALRPAFPEYLPQGGERSRAYGP